MANGLLQLRIDDTLRKEASDIYSQLGLDLPTAIRMFLKKIIMERGIPFDTKLPSCKIIPVKPSLGISIQEYTELVCQVPAGRITRDEDIEAFLAKKYAVERVKIEFEPLPGNPFWDGIPWWRVVSCRGMLYDQLFHSRDEQKSMLEKDGLTVVPCGAYGRSLKVDNYKSLLFADFR